MCGIVGAVAKTNIVPVLLDGIARLEYRGYDSTGLAVVYPNHSLERLVSTARVADLAKQAKEKALDANTGISHTRWATHGAPSETNAHPHTSHDEIALVHNGIIENFETLRANLEGDGYVFITQTDTEVIAHLVHRHYHSDAEGDLLKAVQLATRELKGAYAIAVISAKEPGRLVGARSGSPLVVGQNRDGCYLASDAAALMPQTQEIVYLEEGDTVDIRPEGAVYHSRDAQFHYAPAERKPAHVNASMQSVDLGPYNHFMQKEIFEQPRAIADTLENVGSITPALFGKNAAKVLSEIDSVLILACGTSFYAGQVGKQWIESLAKIPAQVEIASEYRYRDSVPNPKTLTIVVSQSGETADTLAALRHAQELGQTHTLAICNVASSAMPRQTELVFITHAGIEIGVASTKAFTTQLVALFLLALTLSKTRGLLSENDEANYLRELRHLPASMQSALATEPQTIAWAQTFQNRQHALFLGRGLMFPIAEEGALKLKEISYIHAEAYPAGELKHGPLALVDREMPVVAVAPNDDLVEKLKSNLQEVRARGAELYVVADLDTPIASGDGVRVLRVPEHASLLSPIIHVAPLQLLAYHAAVMRGTDVDKPRNLAKSVTVE